MVLVGMTHPNKWSLAIWLSWVLLLGYISNGYGFQNCGPKNRILPAYLNFDKEAVENMTRQGFTWPEMINSITPVNQWENNEREKLSIYYTDISVLFSCNTVLKVTAKTIWLTYLVILLPIGWRECYGSSPTFCRSFKVRHHVISDLILLCKNKLYKKILCGNLHNPKHSPFLQCCCLQTSYMKR